MAAPTFTSITPPTVWTGGQFVTIVGTNFRTPTIPSYALGAPYPPPAPSVSVVVDGEEAAHVTVMSATTLTCILPPRDPGVTAIVIRNLDAAGDPIPGESVTAPTAITYKRPQLEDQPDLSRLTVKLIADLKRQVLDNVVTLVSTDTPDTLDVQYTALTRAPALLVGGPDITPSRRPAMDPVVTGGYPGTTFLEQRLPLVVDLEYTLVGIALGMAQLAALEVAVLLYFKRNPVLLLDRDPTDPAAGRITYPMGMPLSGSFRNTSTANKDNLRSFTGTFLVTGVAIEELPSFAGEGTRAVGGVFDTLEILPTRI